MEASALQAPAGVARSRISLGAPLLRLRSDEQLVALFRAGNDDAFRLIYDRYRQRLFAYTRQMLPGSRQDAEDALQDVFVRAYSGLRANDRDVALRAWLYRVAHNRCIDELRRPPLPAPELIELVRAPVNDPIAEAEQRESLRRLIADVRRLPEQQRSALLMRELSGMSYTELAQALGVSVPAVKSLLVRARVGLAQAMEARETACNTIRDELILAHDRRVRPNANARRHLRDCPSCRAFRTDMRGVSRQFAALAPTIGPLGVLANVLGIGGGGGAAAGGASVAAGGAAGTGFAAGGVLATGAAGHVATLLAAAVVTAGSAVEIQHSIAAPVKTHRTHHHVKAIVRQAPPVSVAPAETSQPPADTTAYSSPAAPAAPTTPAPTKPTAKAPPTAPKQAQAPASSTAQVPPNDHAVTPTGGGAISSDPATGNTVAGTGTSTGTLTAGTSTKLTTSAPGTTPTTGGSTSSATNATGGTAQASTANGPSSTTATGTSSSSTGSSTSTSTGSAGTASSTSSTSVGSSNSGLG